MKSIRCLIALSMGFLLFSFSLNAQNQPSTPPQSSPGNLAIGGSGTTNFIPLWTPDGNTLGNSAFFQVGTGSSAKTGLNIKTPLATLDVNGTTLIRGTLEPITTGIATATKGFDSHPLDFEASAFSSTTHAAIMQHFEWQAEPTGNNTSSTGATLNLLFGQNTAAPAETGLKIAKTGKITFVAGQTFPGTVSSVIAGTGLVGGGSGTPTLSLDTGFTDGRYAQLAASNTFATDQVFDGNIFLLEDLFSGQIFSTDIFPSTVNPDAGNTAAIVAENTSGTQTLELQNFNNAFAFTEAQFNLSDQATFYTDNAGDTVAIGTKSAAVPLKSGKMVKVFSMESPEVWFEDFGSGQLTGGLTTIAVEPKFAQTVALADGYHVFLTAKGDCKGLYVYNETPSGFEVREMGGGQSSVEFDYRIVAHRAGYAKTRLPAAVLPKARHIQRPVVASRR